MASPKRFVTGFNHNVQHLGQVFHVQTEDSGEEAATISTHLFLGGTILATRKDAYPELRGAADLQEQVRARMQAQHKQMLRDLVKGVYDHKLRGVRAFQPGEIVLGSEAPAPIIELRPPAVPSAASPAPVPARPVPPPEPTWPARPQAVGAPQPPRAVPPPFRPAFCDDVVSDLSLDEVILAYLADVDE